MIYLNIVRTCICHVCSREWSLRVDDPIPEKCRWCSSPEWNGETNRAAIAIRHGRAHNRKTINPGAKSVKNQQRAKAQWRRFKPKPVEESQP